MPDVRPQRPVLDIADSDHIVCPRCASVFYGLRVPAGRTFLRCDRKRRLHRHLRTAHPDHQERCNQHILVMGFGDIAVVILLSREQWHAVSKSDRTSREILQELGLLARVVATLAHDDGDPQGPNTGGSHPPAPSPASSPHLRTA